MSNRLFLYFLSHAGPSSSHDIVLFLPEECLEGPLADGPHGVVGHGRDEQGEQLVGARLQAQALVVLRARKHLGHLREIQSNRWE